MDTMPEEVELLIWEYLMENAIFTPQSRAICKRAQNAFEHSTVEDKTRELCRESLCLRALSKRCIYGRYCSVQCAIEHMSGL